jgi:hypothetical protein
MWECDDRRPPRDPLDCVVASLLAMTILEFGPGVATTAFGALARLIRLPSGPPVG